MFSNSLTQSKQNILKIATEDEINFQQKRLTSSHSRDEEKRKKKEFSQKDKNLE